MDALLVTTTAPSPGVEASAQRAVRHATGLDVDQVEFGYYLHELCAGLARANARRHAPVLACTTADATLPAEAAIRLGLVVDELVTNAFRHAFPDGRTGKINVRFAAGPDAWRLTVEDTGVGLWRGSGRPGAGLDIARRLIGELGGRLELPDVFGGTRCVAVAPRDLTVRPYHQVDAALEAGLVTPS